MIHAGESIETDVVEANGYLFRSFITRDTYGKYTCTVVFVRAVDQGKRNPPEIRRKMLRLYNSEAEARLAADDYGRELAERHETGIPQ